MPKAVELKCAECVATFSKIDEENQDTQSADANATLAPTQQSFCFCVTSRANNIAKRNNIFGRHIYDKDADPFAVFSRVDVVFHWLAMFTQVILFAFITYYELNIANYFIIAIGHNPDAILCKSVQYDFTVSPRGEIYGPIFYETAASCAALKAYIAESPGYIRCFDGSEIYPNADP